MPITPDGVPPWLRTTDFSHYGGHADKSNYLSRGAIDALTDVDAAQFARMTSDMASLARTAPFATLKFGTVGSIGDYSGLAVTYAATMGGVSVGHYFMNGPPPHQFPRVDRNNPGDFTITFHPTPTDDFGAGGPFAIQMAKGNAFHSTVTRVTTEIVSASVLNVRVFDETGTQVDPDGGLSVTVY